MISLLLLGCEPPDVEALPDWGLDTAAPNSPAATSNPLVRRLRLLPADDLGYDLRIGETGTGEPCTVEVGSTAEQFRRVDCTVDMAELDLAFGPGWDVEVPPNACAYLRRTGYWFESWDIQYGEPWVVVEVDAAGNVVHSDVPLDEAGDPTCPADYTDQGGPDCCAGGYVLEEHTPEGTLISGPYRYGDPCSCLWGSHHVGNYSFDGEGCPTPAYTLVPEDEPVVWLERFYFVLMPTYATNVTYANHFDPEDHDGAVPAGLSDPEWSQPFYLFQCLDHAEEVLAEIRLVVRDYNEEREFLADGDPDTDGIEPVTGEPVNDRYDWADATPGSTTFIEGKL